MLNNNMSHCCVPSFSNFLCSGINYIFFKLYYIISYPLIIVGNIFCYIVYVLINVYKFESDKKPDNEIFYKLHDKPLDRLHNNPSECMFFLNNCVPVNDDHKHHDHSNHSIHDHSSYGHSSYDHSSHDHSSSHND